MATVIIHAGMPKAGSSSIQAWLARESTKLASSRSVQVLVARREASRVSKASSVVVRPFRSKDPINSGELWERYFHHADEREQIVEDLFRELESVAARYSAVVLSSEAFAQPFWKADELWLNAFNDLSSRHQVVVAYYVRPQHTSLEAAWRQWGYRSGWEPAAFLMHTANQLHYLQAYRDVARIAPNVNFVVRPFRPDLLHRNDVVADFAHHFLGIDDVEVEQSATKVNVGFPLEVVNILRTLPEGLIWDSQHDNQRLGHLKNILGPGAGEAADKILESRKMVQGYSHHLFEADNAQLGRTLGWPASALVPEAPEWSGTDLDGLDELWTPSASPTEVHLLTQLLQHIFQTA